MLVIRAVMVKHRQAEEEFLDLKALISKGPTIRSRTVRPKDPICRDSVRTTKAVSTAVHGFQGLASRAPTLDLWDLMAQVHVFRALVATDLIGPDLRAHLRTAEVANLKNCTRRALAAGSLKSHVFNAIALRSPTASLKNRAHRERTVSLRDHWHRAAKPRMLRTNLKVLAPPMAPAVRVKVRACQDPISTAPTVRLGDPISQGHAFRAPTLHLKDRVRQAPIFEDRVLTVSLTSSVVRLLKIGAPATSSRDRTSKARTSGSLAVGVKVSLARARILMSKAVSLGDHVFQGLDSRALPVDLKGLVPLALDFRAPTTADSIGLALGARLTNLSSLKVRVLTTNLKDPMHKSHRTRVPVISLNGHKPMVLSLRMIRVK